ncbi:ankyrin [Plenodomus tracheiphilus IPT5]|uniref:Ankyrin n=1 Tax=Plenodomus tracheiphilus IPT5 TaxID=1408161 RepID=A0A6A7BDZ7_9PLEO|nr:ankyrin [Plenodomus tracheiphilus IPT5]
MFLEKGSDPDRPTARGDIPIFVAIECAGPPVIQALVKHNADVSIRYKGLSVLQAAFEGPSAQDEKAMSAIFDALLKKGADATVTCPDGKTLLHLAVTPEFGHTRVAYLLISAGVKVNAQDFEGNTALHLAGHSRPCVDLLLKSGANPRHVNANGLTPLLSATTHGDKAREPDLETLIKASDLRKINSHAQTALHLAASNGLERTIRLLLRARAETTLVDSSKNTPLLLAVKHQQWSVVSLLTIPPSVNSWDEDGMSALHHIARSIPNSSSTWADIAAAAAPFCQRGVSRSMRDRSGATPLIQAVKTLPEDGRIVLEALLVQTADRRASWNCVSHEDHKKHDALYYAITMKKAVFVEVLLKSGAMFSLEDWIKGPLDSAAPTDRQILKLLAQYEWARRAGSLRRQHGVPDVEPPAFASVFPVKDVRQLLSMGLEVNALPRSPLGTLMFWAVLRQIPLTPAMPPTYLLDMMKVVLDAGANPNISTAKGSRRSPSPQSSEISKESLPLSLQPLTFLLEEHPSADINLVTLLLTKGAKLSTASPYYNGRLPLHSAVRANRIDVVEEFLLQRADVNCEDKSGRTPLFIAAEQGSWKIADALLRRGAKVNIADAEKTTPLHVAAIGGNKRIVAALLREGAKSNIQDSKNMTPLACVLEGSEEKEKDRILWMLKDAAEEETRQAELQRQQREQNASHEARLKQRKAEEADTQLRRQQEEEGKLQKQRNADAHQQTSQEQPPTQKPTKRTKTPPSPPPAEKTHSMSRFKKPSLFFSRSKHSTPPSSTTPTQPSIISIRINTPPFSKSPSAESMQKSTSTSLPKTTPLSTTNPPKSTPTTHTITLGANAPLKPLPTPRIDSGVGHKTPDVMEKALPALNRENSTLDGGASTAAMKKRESGNELKDWLVLSRMMDGL